MAPSEFSRRQEAWIVDAYLAGVTFRTLKARFGTGVQRVIDDLERKQVVLLKVHEVLSSGADRAQLLARLIELLHRDAENTPPSPSPFCPHCGRRLA